MWTSVHTWHTCQNYFIKKKKKAKHALKPSLISRCLWRRFVIISEMLPFWVPHLPAHINAASLHTSWTRGSFINVSLWTHYPFYLQCPWASFFCCLKNSWSFFKPRSYGFFFDEASLLPLFYVFKNNIWYIRVFSHLSPNTAVNLFKGVVSPCRLWATQRQHPSFSCSQNLQLPVHKL